MELRKEDQISVIKQQMNESNKDWKKPGISRVDIKRTLGKPGSQVDGGIGTDSL